MRFFTSSLLAIAALASAVFAAENPISKPDGSSPLAAGEPITITWTPTTAGPITLKLRQGLSTDLKDVVTVVGGAPNSGSFTWTIPGDMPSGDNYAFQISDDKTNDLNFTPLLSIKSDVGPKSSSSTSPSSSTSSSSSSAATTMKPETTSKHGHNNITMVTSSTAPSNGTTTSTGGYPSGTTTGGGSNSTMTKPTSSGPSSTSSSTGSSPPARTAPSSGAVALVMNSPLALVVCVLGAVMYLN